MLYAQNNPHYGFDMQIVIPLTGLGSRFKAAGYKKLKPSIEVHGKPIINWVTKMFDPDQEKIIFICQKTHAEKLSYLLKDLKEASQNSEIVLIDKWKKRGPVFDILLAKEHISDDSKTLVSYCDYFMDWDYPKYKRDLKRLDPDGSIPCYTGFHPHLLHKKNLYATCKVDKSNYLELILEKNQFNTDKMKDYHSPGAYYFKSGKILKKYCQQMIDAKDSINNEYYASLPFNYMVKDGLKVWCPPNINYFCQWGTPEDLNEYLYWINSIKNFT
jgi:NDP-sugar pyrophosphorylase family protein